jgi:hypothetical protein
MTGEISTFTRVDVTVQTIDANTGGIIGTVSTEAIIENGCRPSEPGDVCEEHIYINIKPGTQADYTDAVVSVNTDSKLTKLKGG